MKNTLQRHSLPLLAALTLLLGASAAHAITFSLFLPSGAGGRVNGQTFTVGAGGEVEEIDAFLGIGGLDLNGAADGVTSALGSAVVPAGLDFSFSTELSADTTDLTLRYAFANNTGGTLNDVTFLSFLDVDIDERINTFFNEYAEVIGAPAAGQAWEIDEPGFLFGDITDNLATGVLDGANGVPQGAPDDVSMAMSFAAAELEDGEIFEIDILISEDGDQIGPLALVHSDASSTGTQVTYSGGASVRGDGPGPVIPEPSAALVFAIGTLIVMSRRRLSH